MRQYRLFLVNGMRLTLGLRPFVSSGLFMSSARHL